MIEIQGRKNVRTFVGTLIVLASTAAGAVVFAQSSSPPSEASASPAPAAPAYTGPPPYYFVRPPRVAAGLTPDSVHRLLTRPANQQAIVQCYTQALATDPHAHSLISVRVSVIAGGIGSVDNLRVAPANDTLRDCVRAAFGTFEWPNPRDVPATEVNAQIELEPTPPANAAHPHH